MKSTELAKTSEAYELLKIVSQKKKAIQKFTNGQFKTNGKFRFTENLNGASVDITRETRLPVLVNIAGFIANRSVAYKKGAEILGLESIEEFTWLGFTAEDWLSDLKLRTQVVKRKDNLDELYRAERDLSQFLTEQDKMKRTLEKYGKLLNINVDSDTDE